MSEIGLPLPVLEGHSADFYGYCRRGELRFQRCSDCGAWRHVPRELCAECGSWEWEWALSSGKGEVFTYTIVGRALHPAFAESVPYAATVVEMEEGVRLLSKVADVAPEQLEIGMRVEVDFEAVSDEISLPIFRRAVD
jgi:uncharacterized OB-fold protein